MRVESSVRAIGLPAALCAWELFYDFLVLAPVDFLHFNYDYILK
jgi:hypothetical protein